MTDNVLKKLLDAGLALTGLTPARAEELVKGLAADLKADQLQSHVENLLEQSRRGTEAVIAMVQSEVHKQLRHFGLIDADAAPVTNATVEPVSTPVTVVPPSADKPVRAPKRVAQAKAPAAAKAAPSKAVAGSAEGVSKKSPAAKSPAKKAPVVATKLATATAASAKATSATPRKRTPKAAVVTETV